MKKGFLLSLDAIAAISLLLTVSLFLAGISFTYSTPELQYQRYYFAGKDIANVVESAKISSISDIVNLTDYGLDSNDFNRTVLDVIGSMWTEGNTSQAENLTHDFFTELLNRTNLNYGVSINNESIYVSNTNSTYFLSRLATIVSGYEKTKPVNGYLARVYMSKASKSNSYFSYLGGYVGDGNITKRIVLPSDANITEVYMELNTGNNFSLYVNGNPLGFFEKTAYNFSADNWTVCSESLNPSYCSYFTEGENILEINFSDSSSNYVGGGYFKIIYKTSELTEGEYVYEGDTRTGTYYFPGIKGILNLYSSFYVPGTLQNITVFLHYINNLTLNNMSIPVYFTIGDKEIHNSNATGEQSITIPDYNISQLFGGKVNVVDLLSNSTVPIRFGTETFAFTSGEGASDSVLITDVSGSMITCDVDSPSGPCDCNSPAPCQRDRINVAKEVDKEFVNTMLEYNGSRVGLVSYTTSIVDTHGLSNNTASLETQIDGYTDLSYTCISCGISGAVNILKNSKIVDTLIYSGSQWLYNTTYPSGDPPDINGTNWTWHNYTDSGWPMGQAMIGFELSPYSPNVITDIGDNGGNYYFRKHFNVSDPEDLDFVELYISSDDNAEVYLNGHLIDNDTTEHDAEYWNRGNVLFYDDFESYFSSGANQVDGNDINSAPGNWFIDDAGQEIYVMADRSSYPSHSGTDVLVFRDMDSYGYAETHLDLAGRSDLELSYWRNFGPDTMDANEYSDVWIWDGTWQRAEQYTSKDNHDEYSHDKIDLSDYNMVDNFTIRFGSRSSWNNERFYIDDVKVRESIKVDTSYFRKGDNVISVKLRNNDATSAKFDLELNATMKRYESILVMSDGFANRCVPGTSCPYGVSASQQAIDLTCEAREKYGIEVYVVAFGSGSDLETLEEIACWNCTSDTWIPNCDRFYNSSNSEDLKDIYKSIAKDIANATFAAQVFNFTGNVSLSNVLYYDSFISFNYTPVIRSAEYGEVTLNFESPRIGESTGETLITDNATGTKEGWFVIPSDGEVSVEVIDSKMTSYSSYYWTDRLWVNSSNTPGQNWTRVYWLGNYSDDYETMGDPYIIQIPSNLLTPGGNNSFKIGTGMEDSLTAGKGGSPDNKVIYSLAVKGVSLTEYSDILNKARGSRPTIYYDSDGDNVPESYVTVEIGPDPDDIFDPQNDSIDNGFMKLLDKMNFINDVNPGVVNMNKTLSGPSGDADGSASNPVDLEITEEVQFNSDFISQIPSMWGPAIMEVKIWG